MSYGRLWFGSSIRAEFCVFLFYLLPPSFWLYHFWVKFLLMKIQKRMEIQKSWICCGSFISMDESTFVSDLSVSVFGLSGNIVFDIVCDLCRGGTVVSEHVH